MKMRKLKCKSDSKGIEEFAFSYPAPETLDEFVQMCTAEKVLAWLWAYLDVKVQAFARTVAADAGIASAIEKCKTWTPGTSTKSFAEVEAAKLAERNAMYIAIVAQVKSGNIPADVARCMGVPEGMLSS